VTVGSTPHIIATPEKIYVNIERSITIPCRVVGIPRATVKWLKNDTEIGELVKKGQLEVLSDDSLVIKSEWG